MVTKVLLLKPPIFNVGDGFVAKGAKSLVEDLDRDVEIIESSSFSYRTARWAAGNTDQWVDQTIGIGEFIDVDVAVLPGCTLYPGALLEHTKIFEQLKQENVPIILLGAGGLEFTGGVVPKVKHYLRNYIDGIITRNVKAYDTYSDSVQASFEGIDCAFFIDKWLQPHQSDEDFVSLTFTSKNEPDLQTTQTIVRPHHEPFHLLPQAELSALSEYSKSIKLIRDVVSRPNIGNKLNSVPGIKKLDANFPGRGQNKSIFHELDRGKVFLSGNLDEYLFIYANANEVHTERVHATIPSLVYNTPVKFYLDSPRSGIFEGLVQEDNDGFWHIKEERFEDAKEQQRVDLDNLISTLIAQ